MNIKNSLKMYKSTKVLSGFTTCFRQWRATDSHCSKLHGYSLEFKFVFAAEELDYRNWVMDFGFSKKEVVSSSAKGLTVKKYMELMFDHTTAISADDPFLEQFKELSLKGVIQLVVFEDGVGCERFAEYVYQKISKLTPKGVKLLSVECIENKNNSAIYEW